MSGQAAAFLAAVAAGFVLGAFYDFFRVFRRLLRHKALATTIEDAAFWIIATLVMFYFLLGLNYGQLRGYLFLGAALGVVLYLSMLSRFFIKWALGAVAAIRMAALWFVGLIIAPFRWFYALVRPPATRFYKTSKNKSRAAKKRLKSGGRYVKMRGTVAYRSVHQKMKRGRKNAAKAHAD